MDTGTLILLGIGGYLLWQWSQAQAQARAGLSDPILNAAPVNTHEVGYVTTVPGVTVNGQPIAVAGNGNIVGGGGGIGPLWGNTTAPMISARDLPLVYVDGPQPFTGRWMGQDEAAQFIGEYMLAASQPERPPFTV